MTTTTEPLPHGPLAHFILDPAGAWRAAAHAVLALVIRLVPWLAVAAAACLAAAAAMALLGARRRAAMAGGGRVVRVMAPPEVDPAGGEEFWRHLHALLRGRWRRVLAGQPHLAFEYRWSDDGLEVRVWVPDCVPPGMVEGAVEAAWPAARTETAPAADAPLVGGVGALAGGAMRLALPGWFPLRQRYEADPLRQLLRAAEGEQPGDSAIVQVVARPAPHRASARCRRAARDLRTGRPPRRAARLLDLVSPGPARRPPPDPAAGPDVRAVLDKAASPLWAASVRYAVAREGAPDRRARRALRGRGHALAAAFAVHAGPHNRLARRPLRRPAAALEGRALRRADLLSTPELAALAHLPVDRIVPGLARAGARPVPPPPGVEGDERAGKALGDADVGGRRPVVLRVPDARQHLHVVGSTGSGKSTLLTRLILQDAEAGRGVVVVDPKGDLVTDVLARLGAAARERVVLLDPASPEGRPGLNVLERAEGVGDDLVVDHLVGVLSRIFESCWGPRLEDALRSACLTLLRQGGATLSDVPAILTRKDKWRRYLDPADDGDELVGFWRWYEALNDGARAQVVGPLLYKLRAFLLRPAIREIVNAPTSSFDVGGLLDSGGLLLVRVPKGTLGDDASRLLGSFTVAKVWQAATGRAARPQEARPDASVYVDECQNFVTTLPRSFDEVLAESSGYRVSWVLAHQHLGQLGRDLRDSISANARNKVFFTVSPEDAFVLARHTVPELTEHDLAHLGAYQAAVRLVAGGADQPACTMATRPLPALEAA